MDHKRILVVEDEKNISDVIKAYLEKEGYEVIRAFDDQEALDKFIVSKNEEVLDLTTNEFKVLLVLASNPQIVFSRDQLIDQAFGYDYDGFQRTVDTYIKNIRQKIEDDPRSPTYIVTVYGAGYKFQG